MLGGSAQDRIFVSITLSVLLMPRLGAILRTFLSSMMGMLKQLPIMCLQFQGKHYAIVWVNVNSWEHVIGNKEHTF